MRIVQGSVCFVLRDDEILLLRRNHPPFLGKWDGLQGLLEFGETPAQAAIREVWEESGLTIQHCEHRAHLQLYNLDTFLSISADLFVADNFSGMLQGSEEGLPEWVPLAQVQELDLVGFVHITLPLVLTPHSFLTGTIQHRNSGEPVCFELRHIDIAGEKEYHS